MNIAEFRKALSRFPGSTVVFALPDGDLIPAEFHVTEVGHVAKHFIDCGGTVRRAESCLLQAWVSAETFQHHLTAGKLAHIFELSKKVLPTEDLAVEVEYGSDPVGQFKVDSVETDPLQTVFRLMNKKTDCLAREACGLESSGCGCGSEENQAQCC